MRKILHQGLEATAALWPDLRRAFGWVEEAAEILKNRAEEVAEAVKSRYQALLERMREQDATAGTLQGAVEHFLKVTQSYWPGLFHCYDVEGLPRTNNDLEQFFGGIRHYERRTTGRKRASPTLVVRGAVRVVATTVSCLCPLTPEQLAPTDLEAWRVQRRRLQNRHQARVLQRRFRRQPDGYLAALEERLIKLSLPP
jgi:hypothetical protein